MKNSKILAVIVIGILIVLVATKLKMQGTNQISPLHVEGRWIKDAFNNTVFLRGVWIGAYADTSTGDWGGSYWSWNEDALRETLSALRNDWGINVICTFIWGDWWLENKATTLNGGTTDIGLRDAIIRTIEIAAEYGIYVQIRLYGCTRDEGRREGFPFQPTYNWTTRDFINFWVNVSSTLKDYPNVIYCLFDEPTAPDGYTIYDYFDVANQTIYAIRQIGSNQLIVIHWGYCGSGCEEWVTWVEGGYTLDNVVFSKHIYRYHGTFEGNPNSPVDIDYIRRIFRSEDPHSYESVMETYNIPLWVTAIGAAHGTINDEELIYFYNTLVVLNELKLGYVAFYCGVGGMWGLLKDYPAVPNRVGEAFISAVKSTLPPSKNGSPPQNGNATQPTEPVEPGQPSEPTFEIEQPSDEVFLAVLIVAVVIVVVTLWREEKG